MIATLVQIEIPGKKKERKITGGLWEQAFYSVKHEKGFDSNEGRCTCDQWKGQLKMNESSMQGCAFKYKRRKP